MPEDTTTTTSTTTTRRPCDACYNGCVQTVSDECVRYTGLNNAALDIVSGDNLQVVIENIINNLVPLLTGEGDRITLAAGIRCAIVNGYLPVPVATDQWTSEQIFQALVKVVCDLQTQIDAIDAEIATLNADYTIECLDGVTSSSDTHDIVQAIITKLCDTVADLAALTLDVDTNYVKLADLDALIAAYIASSSGGSSNQQYLKMVPYVAYEYYGPLTNFDGSGIGFPALGFYKVYLCNGLNGTPDKRGRVAVGAIDGVPPVGIGLDPSVDPAASVSNPNYALYSTAGANAITLTTAQIPAHSHSAVASSTATVSPNPHSHSYAGANSPASNTSGSSTRTSEPANKTTSSVDLAVSVATSVTVSNAGGGGSHSNIQPVIGAYYIMYIP
jgi:microcystin-dependent protein